MSTHEPTSKQLRDFGILLGVVFPLLLGWFLPALRSHSFQAWTLWIGIPSLTLGLLAPRTLIWPYRGWMALGHALGWINGHIILGAVFLLVLQPIAAIMRIKGYDPLRRRRTNNNTYKETVSERNLDFKRPF